MFKLMRNGTRGKNIGRVVFAFLAIMVMAFSFAGPALADGDGRVDIDADITTAQNNFVKYAGNAINLIRFIGVFIVAGALIVSAINYLGGGHDTKNILWKTGLVGIIVIIAPTIMNLIIGTIGINLK